MFIAMEFVSGKDLHQILSKEWPLPEARVVRIVGQVLSALADAHGAGVIHRDLKPENIMVEQRRGEPDFVKVLDFGIAKIQDSTGEEGPALTRAGFVCGTPEYMSPEQARGATLDAPLRPLRGGRDPLPAHRAGCCRSSPTRRSGFATKHLTEEPPPPTKRRPEAQISPAMERLILKALSKDPDDRPQTAEEFRAELLAVDKERRAGASRARAKPSNSSAVLAPLPRMATAPEEINTQVSSNPSFAAASVSATRPVAQAAPTNAVRSAARPDTKEVSAPGAGGAVFKVITVALVLTALGLGYVYFRDFFKPEQGEPIKDAPVPQEHLAEARLFEQEIPRDQRDAPAAEKLSSEGDEAHLQGRLGEAAEKYEQAFLKNPTSELSLKLGELYLQQSEVELAQGWWRRHLHDAPDSKARHYIRKTFSDL